MSKYTLKSTSFLKTSWRWYKNYWRKNWLHKSFVVFCILILVCIGSMYGIARWYMWQQRNQPLVLGASFIPDYAQQLGVNPQDTLHAMLYDLHIKNLRFVSYWEDIEPQQGKYNWSTLDWEFKMADQAHAKVTLSLGLRQPRWPECHVPNWVNVGSSPESQWQPQLEQFMTAVVNRYKNNPALDSYQVENEYFLKAFGQCQNYDRNRLVSEFNLVKKLDPHHTVIISRSNNALGTPVYAPTPDEFGVSVYKRVWDGTLTHRYFEYPFPAWYYAFLAGTEEILTGKNTIIHELQAEPWPPHGANINTVPTSELNKSLDANRLDSRFKYGEATGIKTIYLWGAEDWYFMKVKRNDPSLWNVAKQQYTAALVHNANLKNAKN